jgi:hypothetical protein
MLGKCPHTVERKVTLIGEYRRQIHASLNGAAWEFSHSKINKIDTRPKKAFKGDHYSYHEDYNTIVKVNSNMDKRKS